MFTPVYNGKQMSPTVLARIPIKLHEEFRERCNLVGETINDYVEAAIEFALHKESDFNFGEEFTNYEDSSQNE